MNFSLNQLVNIFTGSNPPQTVNACQHIRDNDSSSLRKVLTPYTPAQLSTSINVDGQNYKSILAYAATYKFTGENGQVCTRKEILRIITTVASSKLNAVEMEKFVREAASMACMEKQYKHVQQLLDKFLCSPTNKPVTDTLSKQSAAAVPVSSVVPVVTDQPQSVSNVGVNSASSSTVTAESQVLTDISNKNIITKHSAVKRKAMDSATVDGKSTIKSEPVQSSSHQADSGKKPNLTGNSSVPSTTTPVNVQANHKQSKTTTPIAVSYSASPVGITPAVTTKTPKITKTVTEYYCID
jgi:hypothetical protein